MKTSALRTVASTVGATVATTAMAQSGEASGGISTSGWLSILVIVAITAGLVWVYKKTT